MIQFANMRDAVSLLHTRTLHLNPLGRSNQGVRGRRDEAFRCSLNSLRLHLLRRNWSCSICSASRSCPGAVRAALSGFQHQRYPSTLIKVVDDPQQVGKRIIAETPVRASVDTVWSVLTDYEGLPSFIPNLESCEKLPNPRNGKILLRQIACSQSILWRLQAQAVLEVDELDSKLGRREARFSAISGDFSYLVGRWIVEPDPRSAAGSGSILKYDIAIQPRLSLPAPVVSYIVRAGLPANIQAIVDRAEHIASKTLQVSGIASWAGVEEDPPLQSDRNEKATGVSSAQTFGQDDTRGAILPAKGPFWPLGSPFSAAAPITAKAQRRAVALRRARENYLGTASVPLPPAGVPEPSIQEILNQRQEDKERLQSQYPAFRLRRDDSRIQSRPFEKDGDGKDNSFRADSFTPSMKIKTVSATGIKLPAEVHLRRLDGLEYLHRRAVAAISIDAPSVEVWKVLTDYNSLADFIPNLAASERIVLPPEAPANVVRVRQIGYKNMLYVCLHAESVLDLIETPYSEIQFRQVAGDLKRFQGKWMLSETPADPELAAPGYVGPQTQLKYAVEVIIPKSLKLVGVIEPVLERVVFEDVPSNLAAIKKRVEMLYAQKKEAENSLGDTRKGKKLPPARKRKLRPRTIDMMSDFSLLALELDRCYGQDAVLPNRSSLRKAGRSDLEKAIAAHGGPAVVARRIGWRLQARPRKPRGYWTSLDNVKQEIDEFIEENGLVRGVMPLKNDFVRAGRFDLARAVERWGGIGELTNELGYVTASSSSSSTEWQDHVSFVASKTGLSGKQGLFELAAETYKARATERIIEKSSDGRNLNGKKRKNEYTRILSVRKEIDAW